MAWRERGKKRERGARRENEREKDEGGRSAGSALCQRKEERRKEVRGVHSICLEMRGENSVRKEKQLGEEK